MASTHCTAAEQYIAVWQLFNLSLISVRSSLGYILAQYLPGLSEVITIENAVTAAGTQHGIDTIVLAYLDLLTLTDSTAGKEGRFHFWHKVVNLLGHFLAIPCLTLVVAVVSTHHQEIATLRLPVADTARCTHQEDSATLLVYHDSRIAMGAVETGSNTVSTLCHHLLRRAPGSALVHAGLHHDVEMTAATNILIMITMIGKRNQLTRLTLYDGRNAILCFLVREDGDAVLNVHSLSLNCHFWGCSSNLCRHH